MCEVLCAQIQFSGKCNIIVCDLEVIKWNTLRLIVITILNINSFKINPNLENLNPHKCCSISVKCVEVHCFRNS